MDRKKITEKFALKSIAVIIIFLIAALLSVSVQAQEAKKESIFKKFYSDFLKYGTVYVAGEVSNAYETQSPSYFVRTNPNNLYDVPQVIDNTVYHPHDYRIGVGFRKLARFDYEIKAKNYYDGKENNIALSSPTSAVKGFEYLIHYEKERERSGECGGI